MIWKIRLWSFYLQIQHVMWRLRLLVSCLTVCQWCWSAILWPPGCWATARPSSVTTSRWRRRCAADTNSQQNLHCSWSQQVQCLSVSLISNDHLLPDGRYIKLKASEWSSANLWVTSRWVCTPVYQFYRFIDSYESTNEQQEQLVCFLLLDSLVRWNRCDFSSLWPKQRL